MMPRCRSSHCRCYWMCQHNRLTVLAPRSREAHASKQGVIPCTQGQDPASSARNDTCTTTHSARSTSQSRSTPSKGSDTLLRPQSIRRTDGHLCLRSKAVYSSERQTVFVDASSDLLYIMMPLPRCEKRTSMDRTIALALFAFHRFNILSESQVLHPIEGLSSAYDTQPAWFLFTTEQLANRAVAIYSSIHLSNISLCTLDRL